MKKNTRFFVIFMLLFFVTGSFLYAQNFDRWVGLEEGLWLKDKPSRDAANLVFLEVGSGVNYRNNADWTYETGENILTVLWIPVIAEGTEGWLPDNVLVHQKPIIDPHNLKKENFFGNWSSGEGSSVSFNIYYGDRYESYKENYEIGNWSWDPSNLVLRFESDNGTAYSYKVISLIGKNLKLDIDGNIVILNNIESMMGQ